MLEAFEIFSTTGVVLWSRSQNTSLAATAINSLIDHAFIEEKGTSETGFRYEKYTLKYSFVKDLGIIFVAVYQSLLHLTWVDQFLEDVKAVFVKRYRDQIEASAVIKKYDFDPYYDELLRRQDQAGNDEATRPAPTVTEKKRDVEASDNGGPPPPSRHQQAGSLLEEATPVQSPDSSRPTTPLPGVASQLLRENRPGSRGSRRARKAASTNANTYASSGDEARRPTTPRTNTKGKKGRVWGAEGAAEEDDGVNLDYSKQQTGSESEDSPPVPQRTPQLSVNASETGTRNKAGQFLLKDLDNEIDSILASSKPKPQASVEEESTSKIGGMFSGITNYFSNIVGGKTLTKADLATPLKQMEEHLLKKNVAREAALRLVAGVEAEMLGKTTASFQSTDAALRPALETALRKLLTPKSSLDLLREIDAVRKQGRPYVISIVGVNGVGKSTNLSKICYFLLQNKYRVLVVAGDTFRSGAVEQLGVHVRNLKELVALQDAGSVDLYQKGYGMDAANLARAAVEHARKEDYDIVLIDTAGRAHTNTTLMSQLDKFGQYAAPDKILQVAEALVGNDSVNQARNFQKAFGKRGLDGFIISKCDTVGEQIGTVVSMVSATGVPVVFLGVGQHYGDLRGLSIPWAVKLLMS